MALIDNLDIHYFDEVTSTNDIVKQAIADDAPEGYVAVAKSQLSGYGRRGNKWYSPEGGLYASVLLEPHIQDVSVVTIGMLTALAVRDTVVNFLPDYSRRFVRIKWPNDVVYENTLGIHAKTSLSKLAGISCEKINTCICLGVGINIFFPSDEEDESDTSDKYTSEYLENLLQLGYYTSKGSELKVDDVLQKFLETFSSLYQKWDTNDFPDFIERLNCISALNNRRVRVRQSRGITEGLVRGISDNGSLKVLPDDSDREILVYEGSVSLV